MGFVKALTLWKHLEGGFVDNPHDPGGSTFAGIRKDIYLEANPGAAFPPSEADAANYLRLHYWVRFHCGELPEPVDAIFFQLVGSSERAAVEILQCAVGEEPDGDLGPATLAAVKAYASGPLADSLLLGQQVYYVSKHSKGDYYYRGLQARVKRVRAAWAAGEI